jgi:agmatine/peptidylarginine deiminase
MQQRSNIVFPAEWHPQQAVQLTWPHEDTDWAGDLESVLPCFVQIAHEILKRESLWVVCRRATDVQKALDPLILQTYGHRLHCLELPSNDTWARDHAPLTVYEEGIPTLLDFQFNGWGNKFDARLDNALNRSMYTAGFFPSNVRFSDHQSFVLEGGSVESDGCGTLLTTRSCLLAEQRNQPLSQDEIEAQLCAFFGAKQVLWLNHGYLSGDDTDGHIDMLARFCDEKTLAYVQALDESDEHTPELLLMKKELQAFRTLDGDPYQLIPLPMAEAIVENGERLPASYANFLILNDAVLLPIYGSSRDSMAISQLQQAFPTREVVGIPCVPLIRQHGSLHCLTMQYPRLTE